MNDIALNDLLPSVFKLTLLEKVRLIRLLAENIEQPTSELDRFFKPGAIYAVYTPQFEAGAAKQLTDLLEETLPKN